MSAQQLLLPFRPVINLRGGLEAGAILDVFRAGTTTRVPIYSDADLTSPLSNPLVADGFGIFPTIYFDDTNPIRVVVKQANGTVVSNSDPYIAGGTPFGTISPKNFGAKGDGITDDTVPVKTAMEAASVLGLTLVGQGGVYAVSNLVVSITNLSADNITLKEFSPNTGDPVTVRFNAVTPRAGSLYLGPGFRVDRSGNGTAGTLNVSAGIRVQDVGFVEIHAEVFGNAKGSGVLVDNAIMFKDESYVHDMFCSHSGITDDIQHGSWARNCDNVITGGLVRRLGNIDRTQAARDRYNRGRAYSGCRNVTLAGAVGPGVDQSYDVTGDLNGGNTCVKIAGAHADYPYSVGFKFANTVLAGVIACATVREAGLCGVMVSGPSTELVNMTSGALVSGVTQIGGGANQAWTDVCMVKLDRNDSGGEGQKHPKGTTITDNTLIVSNAATTFTVASTTEITPSATVPLNCHQGCRVRLTTTGTLPSPLATGTDYFVSFTAQGNIRLSTSLNNMHDGVYVTGLTGGSGTHTITAQIDVDWGVFSNVDAYDGIAPNLEYGNRFGLVPARNTTVRDLRAVVTRATAQSIPNATNAFLTGDARNDPYNMANLTGGSGSSTVFTAPLDGVYTITAAGVWDSGSAEGQAQFRLQLDTGSGFVDVQSTNQTNPFFTQLFSSRLTWTGRLARGNQARIAVFQNDGGARNLTIREITFEYVPQ